MAAILADEQHAFGKTQTPANIKLLLPPRRAGGSSIFDGFAQTNFVRKNHALGKRVAAGKHGGINLMRVQVSLRV